MFIGKTLGGNGSDLIKIIISLLHYITCFQVYD